MNSNIDKCYARLREVVARKKWLVEPLGDYSLYESEGLLHARSDGAEGCVKVSKCSGERNTVFYGFNSKVISSKVSISGDDNVIFVGPYARLANADVRFLGSGCVFYFGAFSTVESGVFVLSSSHNILIGDYGMLSARLIMDTSDQHSIYDARSGIRINDDSDIIINEHVWVGRDVRVNKGAFIGGGSVIGQASVVSGKLRKKCLYAGVPARCIREDIAWSRMKSNSLQEMKATPRHKEFEKKVSFLKAKCMVE